MMIVGKDNLARETIADRMLLSGIPETEENKKKAKDFCDWINEFAAGDYGGYYYEIKENNYKLWRGMEEFV